jgi:hypothetical protein
MRMYRSFKRRITGRSSAPEAQGVAVESRSKGSKSRSNALSPEVDELLATIDDILSEVANPRKFVAQFVQEPGE